MFKISQLRQIVLLAEIGNYRKTASQLGIAHSALSYTVRKFEEKYGAAIFVRKGNITTPSPFGKILIDSAKIALQTIDNAERGIEAMLKMQSGKLVIGADPTASSGPIAHAMIAIFQETPGLEFTVLSRTWNVMEQMLRDGEIDVYCGFSPQTKAADLDFQSIFVQAPWLVCRAGHPLCQKSPRDLGDIRKYKIVFGDAPDWYLEQIKNAAPGEFQSTEELRNMFLTSQDPHLTKAFLIATDAVGLLPAHVARDEVDSGRLVRLDVTQSPFPKEVELVIARREHEVVSPIAMQFSRAVKQAVAKSYGFS
jgi:DNA-binding transcriptional LysR family regulator